MAGNNCHQVHYIFLLINIYFATNTKCLPNWFIYECINFWTFRSLQLPYFSIVINFSYFNVFFSIHHFLQGSCISKNTQPLQIWFEFILKGVLYFSCQYICKPSNTLLCLLTYLLTHPRIHTNFHNVHKEKRLLDMQLDTKRFI